MPSAAVHAAAPSRPLPARSAAEVLRRCACGGRAGPSGECAECRAKPMCLRRSASSPAAPGFAPPLVHDVLRSPGQPLDGGTRAEMEPRFGHSFADVRVHADGRAAESAAAVRAHAYTVGRDVVFGAGKYAPASTEGRRLIAHELAHVVQQSAAGRAAPMPSLEIGAVDAPEERAAEAAAVRVTDGGGSGPDFRTLALSHSRTSALRRQGDGHTTPATRPEPAADRRPACPALDDDKALGCPTAYRSTEQLTCRLSPAHHALLTEARTRARTQVQVALRRIDGLITRGLVIYQAQRSFAGNPPTLARIRQVVAGMDGILGSSTLIEGAACDDDGCFDFDTRAYVDGPGQGPIYMCMRSFKAAERPRLKQTIVHEVAHLAGIATTDGEKERYCAEMGCDRACNGPEHADAWMHFIDCIGGPPAGGTSGP